MVRVRGSYALALMFKDYPGEIYAARKDSPMVLGTADGESFLASDVPALLKYTRDIYYIEDLHSARILPGELHFFDLNGDEVEMEQKHITWDAEAAEKGGYEHFMIKEIHEQPKAIRDTLNSVIADNKIDLSAAGLTKDVLSGISEIHIVACGSAWHAGMVGKYVIEDLAEVPVSAEIASEFRYKKILIDKTGKRISAQQYDKIWGDDEDHIIGRRDDVDYHISPTGQELGKAD
jgi:glucosamine--fructose-6-phosphate aminotransferase (isomerizing)